MNSYLDDNDVPHLHVDDLLSKTDFIHIFLIFVVGMCKDKDKYQNYKEFQGNFSQKISKYMEREDKIRIIKDSFETLRARKIIKTQGDFANLLGISPKSLSAAKNGVDGYCTESLISKIQGLMAEQERSLSISNSPHAVAISGDHNNVDLTTPDKEARMAYQRQEMILVPTIPYNVYKETDVDLQDLIQDPARSLHRSPAVAQFPKTDCHYFVNSDAMLPHLHPNDVLALKKIADSANVINGEICVINSRYNGLIARFVYDDGDYLILKASETQSRFTDMKLHKNDIFGVYRILGLIRTNI